MAMPDVRKKGHWGEDQVTFSVILELLTLLVDIGILVVLIIEFNYDKIQVEKKYFKKRQKKEPSFDKLVVGEMQ